MAAHRAEQSAEVAASPELCFATAIDFDTYPEWQNAVESAEVLERDAEGRAALVSFRIDAKVRKVGYTLRYAYSEPERIAWEFVEGDGVSDVIGEYRIEPSKKGARVTYALGIDVGVPVPGLLARRLTGGVMKRSVNDLKREAEKRAAG